MEFIDTHCHIQSAGKNKGERGTRELWAKSDLAHDEILTNAREGKIKKMLCVGCDLADSKLAIDFVADHPDCWATIGIHPHEAKDYADQLDKLNDFRSLATKNKVVAVGECGFDYFYNHSPKEEQEKILRFQIEVALEHDLPMIFHVREAFDDFWPVFDSYEGIRGVLHSFTDNKANMERAVERGLFIGVNGISTFAKDEKMQEMYNSIPLSNLLLETDAPFLTPVPYRGRINQPVMVGVVADYLADLRGESLSELAKATTHNAEALFKI